MTDGTVEYNLSLDDIIGSTNLVEELNQEQLNNIAMHVAEGIATDLASREKWEEGIERWIELAAQVWGTKNTPWPNASNVKYPLLTTASTQFAARAYSALLPGNNWVNAKTIGKDADGQKRERAIRVSKHMSYQLTDEMEDWEENHDRLLHNLPIVGTAFKKIYFSDELARNVSEFISPKEFVVDYHAKSLAQAERKTHLLYYYEHELETKFRYKQFIRPEEEMELVANAKRRTSTDKTQSTDEPANGSKLHEVAECHTYWDMDGDGLCEPYIIYVHLGNRKVLSIVPNFDEESIIRLEEEVVEIKANEYFTNYIFIPDPNSGIYGLGFGHLLGPLNETLNTIINQLIDAGTMSNLGGGFVAKNFQLRGGTMKFKPQEWKTVNALGRDIKEGIYPLPIREPSGVLFSLLGFLENSGMRVASITKATVALAAIEQGMKVFTSIYKRMHRSFKKELKLLYKLNSQFLADEEYFTVMDEGDGGEQAQIARRDYNMDDINILPYSDPNVASEQVRLAKAQAIFDVLPLGNVNPREATKRYLEATEQPSIEQLMEMPEPQPNPEFQLKQMELMHKMRIDNRKLVLESMRTQISMLREKSVAILNLAKAEGEEAGQQMAIYKDTLDRIQTEEDRLVQVYMQMLNMEKAEQQQGGGAQQQQQPQQ
jgi:chaperonin GroES